MTKMIVPAMPDIKTTVYDELRGVDFSVDPSLVKKNRSPNAVNMISNDGGNPIKRLGWRVINTFAGKINGIFYTKLGEREYIIVHAGKELYSLDGKFIKKLKENIADKKSTCFHMNYAGKNIKIAGFTGPQSKLFILTGAELFCFDGEKVTDLIDEAYTPTIIISRNPTGGGILYESVNLINAKRKESFLGTATDKEYQLSATDINSVNEIKCKNSTGGFDELREITDYTVDKKLGKVTLVTARPPVVVGQDNVEITYSKLVEGYADKIKKCTIATSYGVGGENRAFLSGNPELRSYDFWSELNKPSYFPDLNYATIGTPDTAIMGYQKIGEQLAIIKEDNQRDTTVFFRTGIINNKGEAVFSVKPGIAGAGAVSKGCFVNLFDEPLFLSNNGINATTSTLLNYEKTLKNRSYFLDRKLTAESNLKDAVACEWKGYYLLCVNGNVYILDGRHKSGEKNGNSDFVYECYYWENVPAVCLLSVKGDLYFGTDDGRICKFNTDINSMMRYSDGGVLKDSGQIENGKAIDAAWFTPNDDDGCIQYFKTLQKKGGLVTLSPYNRSSGEICFLVDGNPEEFVRLGYMDIFDWSDIDFRRFTFNSNDSPQEIYFKKKKKKYKRLQIGIRNRKLNEGFGIHQIVKSYVIGGYSKNRRY